MAMKHLRRDYDDIQDPRGRFQHDEPVFLLRAKDRLAPATLEQWARFAEAAGADPEMLHRVRGFANEMRAWQRAHGSKVPDTPREELRPTHEPDARAPSSQEGLYGVDNPRAGAPLALQLAEVHLDGQVPCAYACGAFVDSKDDVTLVARAAGTASLVHAAHRACANAARASTPR